MVEVTEKAIEAAAGAIWETWRAHKGSDATWEDAKIAYEQPYKFPKLYDAVALCRDEARAALEAALASPAEVGEPVAWMSRNMKNPDRLWLAEPKSEGNEHWSAPFPVYAHPPQQEPARLREEDWQVEYEVLMVDGDFCASSTSLPDAKHYAAMYQQDGPVEIIEVRRRKLAEDGL